ncbi:uncharacterized protein [Oscarella lobularis]|uniref:uncharacterized protein n=1 Tax=Oscarella lobularis TaxID=121494 RepID=UPI0033142BA3
MQVDRLKSGLPFVLAGIMRSNAFPSALHRWNTNEEVVSYLISQEDHKEWLVDTIPNKPEHGSLFLYRRAKINKFKGDGHEWKKRGDGKSTREDHGRLKINGVECLGARYAHSSVLSSFHRRRYWLLHDPRVILVHYLNVDESDETTGCGSVSLPRIVSVAPDSPRPPTLNAAQEDLLIDDRCPIDGDVSSALISVDLPVLSPLHSNVEMTCLSELMQCLDEPMEENLPLSIVDVSPEWTFTKGGSKVLVIGSWPDGEADFLCHFGDTKVAATLIQTGVLRCIAPAHESGIVRLRVSCGNSVSSEFAFTYKECESQPLISITPSNCQGIVSSSQSPPPPPPPSSSSRTWLPDLLSPVPQPSTQFAHPQSSSGDTAFSSPVTSPMSSYSPRSTLGDLDDNPSVVDWCEFLGDSPNVIENDFSNLSLSAREQHELYEAASKIQTAFRKYVERREKREKAAAVRIQNYYRKYRRKRMEKAATVIQSQFRTYRQHRKFKQSREAATVIQQSFRHYAQRKTFEDSLRLGNSHDRGSKNG